MFHGEGGGDIKNLNLSHETFEMTLKRLEVEMTNRSEVRDRCSLSAKYFNSANSNDNDNNNNNNNDVSLRDAVLTTLVQFISSVYFILNNLMALKCAS